ncbi:MAG: MotA/TolQ/ExbB proton channel family protein, partial [Myxococcota bacterium]|nr:MotA/TolQ/ExbB proton channel family protein [Myxococcota bacterium]
FAERDASTISAFDAHAAVMVLGGSLSAILVSSSALVTFRTFGALRQILPGLGTLRKETDALESERVQFVEHWREGRRAQAVALAEQSSFSTVQAMLPLVLSRAPDEAVRAAFVSLEHETLARWQPAVGNWELLAKLAPSFGMVGTITGMIQLFQSMGEDGSNLGASISLALLATLYGVAFGAGIAGPIGHFLRNLLDERLGALERCQHSVQELVARSMRESMGGN